VTSASRRSTARSIAPGERCVAGSCRPADRRAELDLNLLGDQLLRPGIVEQALHGGGQTVIVSPRRTPGVHAMPCRT